LTGRSGAFYVRAMFSIQKLAVFALIVAALWLGFRLVGSMDRRRKEGERQARRSGRKRFLRGGGRNGPSEAADVDMVACRVCGDYIPATGARGCGRSDCPYGPAA